MSTLSAAAVVEEFINQWRASDLRDKMPEPGLIDNGSLVELNAIGVCGPHQANGYASHALKMLTAICDANGLTIMLVARPLEAHFGFTLTRDCPATLSTDQLVAWYGRHGFVDATVPGDDTRTMIRRPQS